MDTGRLPFSAAVVHHTASLRLDHYVFHDYFVVGRTPSLAVNPSTSCREPKRFGRHSDAGASFMCTTKTSLAG